VESGAQPERSLTSSVISYLCENNNERDLQKRIQTARDFEVPFDEHAYSSIVKYFLRRWNYITAIAYIDEMRSEGLTVPVELHHLVLEELERRARRQVMASYLEKIVGFNEQDAQCYNIFIREYSKFPRPQKMLLWLNTLLNTETKPNEDSFYYVIRYYHRLKAKDSMVKYYDQMILNNVTPTIKTYQLMMKTIFLWHQETMISEWFQKMESHNVTPNRHIYADTLKHCIFMGSQELAYKFYQEMTAKGVPVTPTVAALFRKLKMYKRGQVLDPSNFGAEDRILPWRDHVEKVVTRRRRYK